MMKRDGMPATRMAKFDQLPPVLRNYLNGCVSDVNLDDVLRACRVRKPDEVIQMLRSFEERHIRNNLEGERVARGW